MPSESPEYLTDVPPLFSGRALRATREMPWKARNELARILGWPRIRLAFALAGLRWGKGWRLYGMPILQVHRRARVSLGDGLSLRSTTASNPLAPNHPVLISARRPGSVLTVGDNFSMTGGVLVAEDSVTIGQDVMVGANCTIADTDFHPLEPGERRANPIAGSTRPIVIEDDVFIGMECLILKGTRIGKGSVIGARSVVSGEIPPGVIAAGNPARIIRRLDGSSLEQHV